MQIGIIGLPMVGKTTLFELLTETRDKILASGKTNVGMARIPDYRVEFLSRLFKPKKTTYAQLEIVDIPGLAPGTEKAASAFLDSVRKADALLHVVRAFKNDLADEVNPIKDIEAINYELLLADLDLVEKRLSRMQEAKKKNQDPRELALLEKLKKCLEEEKPLASVEITEEEQPFMATYQFLTTKPMLLCINIAEDSIVDPDYPYRNEVLDYVNTIDSSMVEVSANIEKEIAELDGAERDMFMEELGINEAGIVRIARTVYSSLELISFFTVGEDEVKAWTIEKGTPARKAAGKIHSDIERGFIRAEVIDYKSLQELGRMSAVKEKGLFRLEGKEYIVQDGDIVHFRFNV